MTIQARLNRHSVRDGDCIIWTGAKRGGYGRVGYLGANRLAYRVAYELACGPVPEGLVLDHLCRNRACINPDHLEPVTHAENILRGFNAAADNARRERCVNGHEFDAVKPSPNNPDRKWRVCITCRRASGRRAMRKRRTAK